MEPSSKRARKDERDAHPNVDDTDAANTDGDVPRDGYNSTAAQGDTAGGGNTAADPPPTGATAPASQPDAPPPPDTYLTREIRHIEREQAGELKVVYVQNDGTPDNVKHLIGLKNVFAKCLPNMPKPYIIRLLFERRHRCVCIVRNDGSVIGGIAYRPFYPQRFAEIAFCAIAQTLQVSGFGTRLMNWTKHYARLHDRCEYFLTYADNNAVGYFSKQGFTKTISMPKDRWHGYIKDYDGGTLMECYIHPTLPFINLPDMMSVQKAAVDGAVQKYSQGHVIRPGISHDFVHQGPIPVADIPGVREAGWDESRLLACTPQFKIVVGGKMVEPTDDNLRALMESLLKQLDKEEALIWPFRDPVDPEQVPDYHTIIKDPIDLNEIKRKLAQGNHYITLDIFAADVQRIFNNAKIYNSADTHYYKAAHKLSGMFTTMVNNAVFYE